MTILYDTHKTFKALRQAGVGEPMAEDIIAVLKDFIAENMATKADLKNVEQRLNVRMDTTNERINTTNERINTTNERITSLKNTANERIDGIENTTNERVDNLKKLHEWTRR